MRPGIHNDITINDYHGDKTWISATGLKHAKKSLAQYRLYLDGYYDKTKPHFDFGNAVELYLLDMFEFEEKVAVLKTEEWARIALAEKPELKVVKACKTYKELEGSFLKENEGKYIIPDIGDDSFETIKMLVARCQADKWVSTILENIKYQQTLCWIDPATQLSMKTRPDICQLKNNIIINLKSALDASPEAFSRDLAKFDYPLQACCEIAGVEATGFMPKVDKYFWLVLEKNAPFNVQLYEFDMGDVAVVMDDYDFILGRIKRAFDLDAWPGYSDRADNEFGILTAKVPGWYKMYENFSG